MVRIGWGKKRKSISSGADRRSSSCGLAIVGIAFAGMGLLMFSLVFLVPLFKVLGAKDWVETPCVVVSSEVRSHRGEDSTTYSIEITYDYSFGDGDYRGDRYSFLRMSSSGRTGKQKVVDKYLPGTESTCFVNQRNPSESALKKGISGGFFVGLFPLVFVIIGVLLMFLPILL